MKLSIIVPVYNEVSTIGRITEEVRNISLSLDKEIIIVDDGSDDGSAEAIRRIKGAGIKKIFHKKNQGKGAAVRAALKEVSGDLILIQDADLEYSPQDYPPLLKPLLEKKADVVFGSRFNGAHRCFLFTHYLGNKIINLIANILYNTALSDFMTCYKAFRAGALKGVSIKSNRFGFEAEVTGIVFRRRLKVYEVPVSYNGRDYNTGKKIMPVDFFSVLWWLVRTRFVPRY